MYSKQILLGELYSNVLTVIFKKTDGSMRKMRCTLMTKYLPDRELPEQRAHTAITVWDLDEREWRRFRVESVQTIIKEFESDMAPPVTPSEPRNAIRKSIMKTWAQTSDADAEVLDDLYAKLEDKMRITDDATLYYLIFWNNGCSGASVHPLVPIYKAEMERRGKPYNDEIANIIEEETELRD